MRRGGGDAVNEASPDTERWRRRFRMLMVVVLTLAGVAHVMATLQPAFVDETFIVRNIENFFSERTIVPAFFSYPTLYSYLSAPFAGLFVGGMVLSGMPPAIGDWTAVSYYERLYALWPQRLVVFLSFALACLLVYLIVLELTERRWAGLLGATLLATAPGCFRYSGLGLPDVPTMMFATAALLFALRLARGERPERNALLAGLLGGLAVATKYNAVLLAPPLIVAAWAAGNRWRLIASVAGAAAIGFLIGSPAWLIAPGEYLEGMRYEMGLQRLGLLGTAGVPLLGQLELTVESDPHLLIMSLVGVIIVLHGRERRWQVAVLLTLVAAAYVVAAPGSRQRLHYLLPAWPAMAALVAWGVAVSAKRTKVFLGTLAVVSATVACGLIMIQGFTMAAVPQSERVARTWLHRHVEPMTPIALDWAYVPDLLDHEQLADLTARIETDYVQRLYSGLVPYRTDRPQYTRDFLETAEEQYIVTSSGCYERFFDFGVFTRRPPDREKRAYPAWAARKGFYEDLFAGYAGWRPVYDVWTGNGPRVVIFARGEALEKHGARPMELP